MPEPTVDEHWQSRGETLEDLRRLQEAQPWETEGLRLSREAFTAFALAGSGLLRRVRVTERGAIRELVSAGLVDEDGALTQDGSTTHTVLREADRRVRVESVATGVPGVYEAARLQGSVVVWATDSPQRWAGQQAQGQQALSSATAGTLLWLPTMQLPADLAAWLQVGPAWPMATEPDLLSAALVAARGDDPSIAPPTDADENLRSVWSEPWFTWTLTTDTEHRVAGVHAGRHGHFRMTPDGPSTGLQSLPSETLFSMLVGVSLL